MAPPFISSTFFPMDNPPALSTLELLNIFTASIVIFESSPQATPPPKFPDVFPIILALYITVHPPCPYPTPPLHLTPPPLPLDSFPLIVGAVLPDPRIRPA